MASLGDLVVNLSANSSKFDKGMGRAQGRVSAFASSVGRGVKIAAVAGFGAAAVGAVALTRKMADLDKVAKLASRTGLEAKTIAAFGFAAEQSGSDVATANKALDNFSRRLGEAASGSGAASETLGDLGLSIDDLLAQSPDQRLSSVAQAISEMKDPTLQADAAMQLFGRSGMDMLNLLQTGEKGLKAFQDEADKLGLGFSAEELAKVEAANDAMNRIKRSVGGLVGTIAIKMAPVIEHIASSFTFLASSAKPVIDFISSGFGSAFEFIQDVVGDATVAVTVMGDNWGAVFSGLAQDIPKFIGAAFDWIIDNTEKVIERLVNLAKAVPGILEATGRNIGEQIAANSGIGATIDGQEFNVRLSDEAMHFDPFKDAKLGGEAFSEFKMPEFSDDTKRVLTKLDAALEASRADRAASRAAPVADSLPDLSAAPSLLGDSAADVIGDTVADATTKAAEKAGAGFMGKGSESSASIIARAFNQNRGQQKQTSLLQKIAKNTEADADKGPEIMIVNG